MSEKFLPEEEQKAGFEPGQRVRHGILGEGTVTEVDLEKKAYLIQFDSLDTKRRISFRVRLESVENS